MKSVARLFGTFAFTITLLSGAFAADYPEKPIRVIVPLAAGGGSDVFARMLQPNLQKDLGVPIVIVNVPGAGTAIGSRQVLTAEPDGYTVLLNHVALHSLFALGKTDFSYKDLAVVAGTTAVPNMIVVRADSPYKTLNDLFSAAKKNPDNIIAGVNIGAPNHLSIALAAARSGNARFRYVQTGGATETVMALLGEQAAVGVLTTADAAAFRDTGELRVLSVLDNERNSDYPDVPTAKEQGIDVRMMLDYYWYMPKGTPQERIDRFADALENLMKGEGTQRSLKQLLVTPTFTRGKDAEAALAEGLAATQEAAKAAGLNK